MASTSVMEHRQRPSFPARRFLELVIPPKVHTPPNFCDTQNLAMYFYSELNEISEIVPNSLYLSGCSPVTEENLESLGITGVVCALSETEERRMMGNRRLPENLKKFNVRLVDADCSDIAAHFNRAGQFIDQEIRSGGKVLVHCAAGISRSSTILLAYLMEYRNYDLRTAFSLVKSARRVVRPNNGFFQYLINYERSMLGDDREPSVKMIKENEEDIGDSALIPDVVLEHAKRIASNHCRYFG